MPAYRTRDTHSRFDSTQSSPAATKTTPTHRRRRSTASDINERRPKKGDDDYIKRPENAFILFRRKCCEDRNLALGAKEAGEGADGSPVPITKKQRQADLSKTISQQWKSLPPEERQYWEDLAKEKKKEHEQLYPNYVYRPQRVKGKKTASQKGKGKSVEDDEVEEGEGLSCVLPVPARQSRRAASAPTPPLYYQQAISVPSLFMPSTPTSPSMMPMVPRHPSLSNAMQIPQMNFDYVPPSNQSQQPFPEPQGWDPDINCSEEFQGMFEPTPFTINGYNKNDVPVDSLCVGPDQGMFAPTQQQLVSPAFTTGSSGSCSPQHRPYTPPAVLEVINIPDDAWQQHATVCVPDSQSMTEDLSETLQFEYQPYAWSTDIFNGGWTSGTHPLFNEDFDLSLIPPIELGTPKYHDNSQSVPVESFGCGFQGEQFCNTDMSNVSNQASDPFTTMFGLDELNMTAERF
ncbi:hypothetical protein EW146_g7172 [Bondarzewia mesenterica]|uniref:HMG box domain-containing protein n=1 Tax=Bondarzewia mesenterica TaxID=1095465 RepID=A0A4S4LLP4_9AGAM|nr:hypothetical protein EW146_g7172 [Bondarzewia mesenterica]